jgi:hypothetical protein
MVGLLRALDCNKFISHRTFSQMLLAGKIDFGVER